MPRSRQRLDQVGGGEHAALGHDRAQVPAVVELARPSAAPRPCGRGRLERGRQRLAQQRVHEVVADMGVDRGRAVTSCPTWSWMNRRSTPSSVRCVTYECRRLCGVKSFRQPKRVPVGDEPGVDLRAA